VCDDGSIEAGVARMAPDGSPMWPGERLAVCGPDGYRVVELRGGPPQVSTPAYRDGWARTFDRTLN
jgi:hypothetical protein